MALHDWIDLPSFTNLPALKKAHSLKFRLIGSAVNAGLVLIPLIVAFIYLTSSPPLWALFTYVRPALEVQLEKLKPLSLFLLSQFIPILLLFWQYSPSFLRSSTYTVGIGAIGIGIGLFINHSLGWSLAPSKTRKEFVLRAMIGVIGTFLCYFFVSLLPLPKSSFAMFCKFLFLSFWITTGSLLLCRKLFPSSKFLLKVK